MRTRGGRTLVTYLRFRPAARILAAFLSALLAPGPLCIQAQESGAISPPAGAAAQAQLTVPGVVGQSARDAQRVVMGNGIQQVVFVASKDATPSADRAFTVQGQEPAAGTPVEWSRVVFLTVYGAYGQAEQVRVPAVQGWDVKSAVEVMRDAGFRTVSQVAHPDAPPKVELAGRIANQLPAGGSQADKGMPVTLSVYAQFQSVPSIFGMTPAQAQHAARLANMTAVQAGELAGNTVAHKRYNGLVASQTPPAGAGVPADKTLAYKLFKYTGATKAPGVKQEGHQGTWSGEAELVNIESTWKPSSVKRAKGTLRLTVEKRDGKWLINNYLPPEYELFWNPLSPFIIFPFENYRKSDPGFNGGTIIKSIEERDGRLHAEQHLLTSKGEPVDDWILDLTLGGPGMGVSCTHVRGGDGRFGRYTLTGVLKREGEPEAPAEETAPMTPGSQGTPVADAGQGQPPPAPAKMPAGDNGSATRPGQTAGTSPGGPPGSGVGQVPIPPPNPPITPGGGATPPSQNPPPAGTAASPEAGKPAAKQPDTGQLAKPNRPTMPGTGRMSRWWNENVAQRPAGAAADALLIGGSLLTGGGVVFWSARAIGWGVSLLVAGTQVHKLWKKQENKPPKSLLTEPIDRAKEQLGKSAKVHWEQNTKEVLGEDAIPLEALTPEEREKQLLKDHGVKSVSKAEALRDLNAAGEGPSK